MSTLLTPRRTTARPAPATSSAPAASPARATAPATVVRRSHRWRTPARFVSLLYVFVVAFLAAAVIVPTLVAGWAPLAVVSGSMQPAIAPGAVVLIEPAESGSYYAHPTIISYEDPARPGQRLTHRIAATEQVDGAVRYTTRGDANQVEDTTRVPHDEVEGAVRMVVPFVGLPAAWVHNGQFAPLVALIVVSGLVVAVLVRRGRE